MKRINLKNGDFITVDEKANGSKKSKKSAQPEDTEIELSALVKGFILGAAVVAGLFFISAMRDKAEETGKTTDEETKRLIESN